VIVDCAHYRSGRRQQDGPMEIEQAAELARGKDEDGFIWIGLFEPSEDEFAEDPLAFLRDVDDHLKLVNEELVGQRESLAVVLQANMAIDFIARPDCTPRNVPRLPSPRCSSMCTSPTASGVIPGQP
jgi:hypothetical protein